MKQNTEREPRRHENIKRTKIEEIEVDVQRHEQEKKNRINFMPRYLAHC